MYCTCRLPASNSALSQINKLLSVSHYSKFCSMWYIPKVQNSLVFGHFGSEEADRRF